MSDVAVCPQKKTVKRGRHTTTGHYACYFEEEGCKLCYPDDAGSRFFRNAGKLLPGYTAMDHRMQYY
jgi:hypothetical protein